MNSRLQRHIPQLQKRGGNKANSQIILFFLNENIFCDCLNETVLMMGRKIRFTENMAHYP